MAGRDASPARGQGVKPPGYTKAKVGVAKVARAPGKAHTIPGVRRTLATRLPRRWGGR
jgi:hypothetical protein